jgi:hypothetical protein
MSAEENKRLIRRYIQAPNDVARVLQQVGALPGPH